MHGQNFVALYARGDQPHQRVVLAVDRVDRPGLEADTAVAAIKRLHAVAGAGIQAVVYDGAMRGVHIDELMTSCGARGHQQGPRLRQDRRPQAARTTRPRAGSPSAPGSTTPPPVRAPTSSPPSTARSARSAWTTPARPVVLARLERTPGQTAPPRPPAATTSTSPTRCPAPPATFLAWVTPHGEPGDTDHRRADAVRVIAEGEPDFTRLYGLRNDAESFNSQLKRTLLVDRAMSLGGQRQLLDVLCYGLLHNAVNALHAAGPAGRGESAAQLAA